MPNLVVIKSTTTVNIFFFSFLLCSQSSVQSESRTKLRVEHLNSSLMYVVQIQCDTNDKCSQCSWSEDHIVPSGESFTSVSLAELITKTLLEGLHIAHHLSYQSFGVGSCGVILLKCCNNITMCNNMRVMFCELHIKYIPSVCKTHRAIAVFCGLRLISCGSHLGWIDSKH